MSTHHHLSELTAACEHLHNLTLLLKRDVKQHANKQVIPADDVIAQHIDKIATAVSEVYAVQFNLTSITDHSNIVQFPSTM
jgi:hypothetical protein